MPNYQRGVGKNPTKQKKPLKDKVGLDTIIIRLIYLLSMS